MSDSNSSTQSRREFLRHSAVATSAALSTAALASNVHAGGSDYLRVGLIGCGGRGLGATENILDADPAIKIVALGDAFRDRVEYTLQFLTDKPEYTGRIEVGTDRCFTGFDAYKQVVDSDVDIVLHAAPPHFRPAHLAYAVEKGKHCFVEKPVGVDVQGVRSVMETCAKAESKGLAIVSGLCWRYDNGVRATMEQIDQGAIGDIVSIESTYNAGTLWHRGDEPEWSRMEYQLRNWIYYNWLSGDHIVEQAIHSLDKTAWLLGDKSPVKAVGIGGRQQRTDPKYGHVFDHHVVTYQYEGGAPVFFTCRQQENCAIRVEDVVRGTKGTAHILGNRIEGETKWRYRGPKPSMYRLEQEALVRSIREGKPINDGHFMTNSNLIAIMGRHCTYTGQELTWEQVMASEERLGPTSYEWGDMPEPPVAIPGITKLT